MLVPLMELCISFCHVGSQIGIESYNIQLIAFTTVWDRMVIPERQLATVNQLKQRYLMGTEAKKCAMWGTALVVTQS